MRSGSLLTTVHCAEPAKKGTNAAGKYIQQICFEGPARGDRPVRSQDRLLPNAREVREWRRAGQGAAEALHEAWSAGEDGAGTAGAGRGIRAQRATAFAAAGDERGRRAG